MLSGNQRYYSALQDFRNARRKAFIREILARLTGRANELLSYDEVAEKLKLNVRTERGIKDIPLKSIIGSVGRYNEFNRDFLPLKEGDQQRWARLKSVVDNPENTGLPPIEVYQVGEAYFVLDGNHRVSVAREEGWEFISAHVIEVKTDVPLAANVQPDELIIKAEYAEFLEKTDFANIRPGIDLSISVPGQYETLLEHIQIHRYFMGLDLQKDISYPEAVGHWYDVVYTSIIEPVREHGLLHWFPGRTETDIYLWVSKYRANLEDELGWSIPPEAVAGKLAKMENPASDVSDTGSWRLSKMFDRYTDRLFHDILVPVSGIEAGWLGLELAIFVANKESATLHGLHVIPPNVIVNEEETEILQTRFSKRCQQANLLGSLIVEKGNVAHQIRERALLTDLVVLDVLHPPAPGISSLRSGLRSIIWTSSCPILTVAGKVSPLDNVLLAFDGSPKSKEALFVATYLAEKWLTKLTVLTIGDPGDGSIQKYVRSYLDLHEITADYIVKSGSLDIFLDTIKERQINLVVIGSYSGTPLTEVLAGSAVNFLLRKSDCSLLICR